MAFVYVSMDRKVETDLRAFLQDRAAADPTG
jgi:hypothetical protein